MNREYCHHLINVGLCSIAYSDTAINEILLTDRSVVFYIDITKKTLDFEYIDYRKHTVPLDDQEGIDILDRWVEFWGNVFRGIAKHTKFISADLSGGFDSRMSLLVLLRSGIDLNKIIINSTKNDEHPTYREDYEIASKIAQHYGFKLNQQLFKMKGLNYSFSNSWNLNSYVRQPFHKISYLIQAQKFVNKRYTITGQGGETIRDDWHISPTKFLANRIESINKEKYFPLLSEELSQSMEKIIKSAFEFVCEKYKITDLNSEFIPQYLYQETRCRNHFGRQFVFHYLKNIIVFPPTLDSKLHTVQLNTKECSDTNLLTALLYVRYEPDLLTFPFQGGRSIAPETIEYAKKLNERFPSRSKDVAIATGGGIFHLQPRDLQTEKIIALGKNNPGIHTNLLQDYMKAIFNSCNTYSLFTKYFNVELYYRAAFYYDNDIGRRDRMVYPILGITKVLEDVEISQRNRLPLPQNVMKHFLEQDFANIHTPEQIPDKFKPYLTARIDVKLLSTEGEFQILSKSDEKAIVTKPTWMQKGCIGYQIISYVGKLKFFVKASIDGNVQLRLRGLDIRDTKDRSKNIPYWIDYTNLSVNDNVVLDNLTPAWARKPYEYAMDAKANEEIKIEIEWLPHRSYT